MVPNLAAMAGVWLTEELNPPIANLAWTPIAPADPNRWLIAFSTGQTGQVLVSTIPDPGFLGGTIVQVGDKVEFPYTLYGELAQKEWFGCDFGGRGNITVYLVSIRPSRNTDAGE